MFLYTHPVYPRHTWERIFKQAYNLGLVLNFGAWIICFTDFYSRLSNTWKHTWGASDASLADPIVEILKDCDYTSSFTINGVQVSGQLNAKSAPLFFLLITVLMIGIFVSHGLLIFSDFWAKVFFALNIRNLRVRGLYIRINTILLFAVLIYGIATLVIIGGSVSLRELLVDFIGACSAKYIQTYGDKFVRAEHDTDVVFGTSFSLIIAAVVIDFFIYLCAFMHLFSYALRDTNAKLCELKHPWEVGFFCKPNKPELVKFTLKRLEDEQAVKYGVMPAQNQLLQAPRQESFFTQQGNGVSAQDRTMAQFTTSQGPQSPGGPENLDQEADELEMEQQQNNQDDGNQEAGDAKKRVKRRRRRHRDGTEEIIIVAE